VRFKKFMERAINYIVNFRMIFMVGHKRTERSQETVGKCFGIEGIQDIFEPEPVFLVKSCFQFSGKFILQIFCQ